MSVCARASCNLNVSIVCSVGCYYVRIDVCVCVCEIAGARANSVQQETKPIWSMKAANGLENRTLENVLRRVIVCSYMHSDPFSQRLKQKVVE